MEQNSIATETEPSEQLARQRALAEALFNSIGDGAVATDEYGRITRINPTALRILGYSQKDVLGSWFPKKIVAFDDNDEPINIIDRPIIKAFLTGKTISERASYRKKNGQKIPVDMTVSPIILEGRPVGAIEVFRDITLEQEVDRMKSDFISLASHQLRTPLSAVKTYAHLLLDGYMGEVNDNQRKSLRTIISAANRMNELISTLLNITRVESGTIAINLKTVHTDKLAEEVNKEHGLMAAEKNIDLSLKTTGSYPTTVITDTLILKEVLSNLISNAIKYTPDEGKVIVSVKPRKEDVLISVKDTGMGIPAYSQEHVFTKFFRAHNVVKHETSGTGLGLYLVQGLLKRLNGRIWFKSEEGKGTTFYITIPRELKKDKTNEFPA